MQYLKQKIAVLGIGLEALDLLDWLKTNSKDCAITLFDQNPLIKQKHKIKGKYQYSVGKNYLNQGLTNFDIIFRSPGFYRLHPALKKAQQAGVTILSPTKLFFDLCPSRIIGVTGTKGKGTTTTLIHTLLTSAEKTSYLAGNIGKPFLKLLPLLKSSDWVCLELSSFQLQDLTKSPHISVLLNITSEHLNVHQSTNEYRLSKTSLVKFQKSTDHAVINKDYTVTRKMAKLTSAKLHLFSRFNLKLDRSKVKLRGDHNLENISAAMTVAKIIGLSQAETLRTIYQFKGLEHRLEEVRTVKGVTFYNDSFSTTPETAIAAIKSFSEPTTIILGGSDKGSDYTQLSRVIVKAKNIKTIILIGQMASKIKTHIEKAGSFKGEYLTKIKTMAQAVKLSFSHSAPGSVVILSPACASFGMFLNYKDRGKQFKDAVKALS
jgi:UDP-N-acetylmuramoylalanine--D-glutamate ligase